MFKFTDTSLTDRRGTGRRTLHCPPYEEASEFQDVRDSAQVRPWSNSLHSLYRSPFEIPPFLLLFSSIGIWAQLYSNAGTRRAAVRDRVRRSSLQAALGRSIYVPESGFRFIGFWFVLAGNTPSPTLGTWSIAPSTLTRRWWPSDSPPPSISLPLIPCVLLIRQSFCILV